MSAHQVWITRDQAELVVDLVEAYYDGKEVITDGGTGLDFTDELREKFGMIEREHGSDS